MHRHVEWLRSERRKWQRVERGRGSVPLVQRVRVSGVNAQDEERSLKLDLALLLPRQEALLLRREKGGYGHVEKDVVEEASALERTRDSPVGDVVLEARSVMSAFVAILVLDRIGSRGQGHVLLI